MRIVMKEVGSVTKEKNYFYIPVKYQNGDKVEERKIFSFAEVAYKAMKEAKVDDIYDVRLVKDKNGYWAWDAVVKSDGSAVAPASTSASTRGGSWETPEERARRQVLIVRQSSLAQAVAFGGTEDIETLLDTAFKFETWVNRE